MMNELILKMNGTKADKLSLSVFHISIFLIGCPGNLLVLIAFGLSKELRTRPSNTCLLLLTISDFLTTLFAPPYYSSGLMVKQFDRSKPESYLNLCKVAIFVLTTTGITRIFSFTLVSVDRFIAIVYPYYYAQHCTRMKICIVGVVIWVHAMLSTLPAVLVAGWLEYYGSNESICKFTSKQESIVYTAPMVIFNFTIPTLAVLIMNIRVFWIARGKLRKVFDEKKQFCQHCVHGNEMSVNDPATICEMRQPDPRHVVNVFPEDHLQDSQRCNQTLLSRIEENIRHTSNRSTSIGLARDLSQNNKMVELTVVESRRGLRHERGITPERSFCDEAVVVDRGRALSFVTRKRSSLFWKHFQNKKCEHGQLSRSGREIKILLSTLVLAFAFILTWAPYVLTRLIITVWRETNSLRLQMFASAGTVINCGLNPVIILVTRKEVRDILCKKFLKKNAVSSIE